LFSTEVDKGVGSRAEVQTGHIADRIDRADT
jgi:hypothetical protein